MLSDRIDGSLNVERDQGIMTREPQESGETFCQFSLIIDNEQLHQQPSLDGQYGPR